MSKHNIFANNVDVFNSLVYLLDTKTGVFGIYRYEGDTYSKDGPDVYGNPYDPYWWIDGNAGCDCNRSIFLYGMENENLHYECNNNSNIIKILAIAREDTGELLWEGDFLEQA